MPLWSASHDLKTCFPLSSIDDAVGGRGPESEVLRSSDLLIFLRHVILFLYSGSNSLALKVCLADWSSLFTLPSSVFTLVSAAWVDLEKRLISNLLPSFFNFLLAESGEWIAESTEHRAKNKAQSAKSAEHRAKSNVGNSKLSTTATNGIR